MVSEGSLWKTCGSLRFNFVTAAFTPTAGKNIQNLGFEIVHLGPLETLLSVCPFGAQEFHRGLVSTVEAAWHRCKGTLGDVTTVLWDHMATQIPAGFRMSYLNFFFNPTAKWCFVTCCRFRGTVAQKHAITAKKKFNRTAAGE